MKQVLSIFPPSWLKSKPDLPQWMFSPNPLKLSYVFVWKTAHRKRQEHFLEKMDQGNFHKSLSVAFKVDLPDFLLLVEAVGA